jgi:hypothetical protein
MKFMIVVELPSTAAAEISWFHGFVSGNGRNPFRLASCPTANPLHAEAPAVTAVIVAAADLDVSATLVAEIVYEPAAAGAV